MDHEHAAQLKELLIARRAAVDPAEFPTLLDQLTNRTGPGLTQHDLALLTGRSTRHVRNLESGQAPNPSAEWLEAIASVLRMSQDERILLYRLAVGHDPIPDLTSPSLPTGARPQWEAILQATAFPSYLSGPFWDVEFANSQYRDLLPDGALDDHRNVMKYCLLEPSVRDELLLDWGTEWAPPMVAQVKAAVPMLGRHPTMQALVDDLRTDAAVDKLWRGISGDAATKVHPNGDRRRIRHPRFGEQRVLISASTPMGFPGHRIIVLVPVGMPAPRSGVAEAWRGYAERAEDASEAMRGDSPRAPRQRRRSRAPALGWAAAATREPGKHDGPGDDPPGP